MMTEELKKALKDQNLYSHQAMYGAEVAFGWVVEELNKVPLPQAVLKLSEWWEMLKAEEDMAVESATDGV
jgi:hypothetical protein